MGDPVARSRRCFVCGTANPSGLGLAPEREGKKVVARFTPGEAHRGYAKAMHGGLTASLLDEVVGVATGERAGGMCATVELAVSYRRPVLIGVEVRAEGWYVRRQGKLLLGAGRLLDGEGKVLATARARFLPLDERQLARFVDRAGDSDEASNGSTIVDGLDGGDQPLEQVADRRRPQRDQRHPRRQR
jgi:uncharacterized protein (TIGR00369 family)